MLHKTHVKWIKDLNWKSNVPKLSEEKDGKYISRHSSWRELSEQGSTSTGQSPKNQQVESYEIGKFLHTKKIVRKSTEWKKVFINCAANGEVVSRIHKELPKLNTKNPKLSGTNWACKMNKLIL